MPDHRTASRSARPVTTAQPALRAGRMQATAHGEAVPHEVTGISFHAAAWRAAACAAGHRGRAGRP
ncbi:MAG TPA: hypothetical protein VMV92_18940 [Streptosporangiaceae bacterium]|nr:hypothetical protein [Streptosporangiaceae bacterium]